MALKTFTIGNKYNPRELMELAVEEMRKSIPKHTDRTDPLVGAVLAKEDGTLVDVAHRGELRQGDHVEFTVLERKHRTDNLGGYVIFATLEPCAPGARSHTKLGCAERIVNARLKKVYLGIEDPDPSVKGNGMAYLRNKRIEIEFFDQDLQHEINEANAQFLEEARERAKQVELDALEQSINPLDRLLVQFDFKDFSTDALEMFREKLQIGYQIDSKEFKSIMLKWGIIKKADKSESIHPTGIGLLLFGKQPQVPYPQSLVKFTLRKGGEVIPTDFSGPLVLMLQKIEVYLKSIFPSAIDRSTMAHTRQKDIYFEVLREVIINAIVHRDYKIQEININVKIDDLKVVVESPGAQQVALERLQDFTAPTISVNPKIASVFYEMKFIEKRNLGMEELMEYASRTAEQKPEIEFDTPYLVVRLFRKVANRVEPTFEDIRLLVQELGKISVSDFVNRFGGSSKKASRKLNEMVDIRNLNREGEKRGTKYFIP
jgi:ATP-dependent DNA helicase RecG